MARDQICRDAKQQKRMSACGFRAGYVRTWTTTSPNEKLEVNARAFRNAEAARTWFATPSRRRSTATTRSTLSSCTVAVFVLALSAWTALPEADLAPYLNDQLSMLRGD